MIEQCNLLYQELLDELKHYRSKGLPFLVETEYCFHAAEKFRGLLRNLLDGHDFPFIEEEIHYFKIIKPKFIAESEYASLLNFSGNFSPTPDVLPELIEFWKRQANRLAKFTEKHKDFYTYHTAGKTHLDAFYYTRFRSAGDAYPDKTSSDFDILAGQLIAHERYTTYANEQLRKLLKKAE